MCAARLRTTGQRADAYAFVAGAVFCVSGMAKSLDAALFADTLARYGSDWLRLAAPCLILSEVCIGLRLVAGVRLRRTAAAGAVLTVVLTAAYLYGYLFRNVANCGCFGRIELLNTSLAGTLCRNAVLAVLLASVIRRGGDRPAADRSVRRLLAGTLCLAAFICGYTFRGGMPRRPSRPSPVPLHATPLAHLVETSPDSTYLFFAFSYTCPHCLNSIENLNRYEAAGVVDRVVAFAVENEAGERRFHRAFEPRFEIQNRPAEDLSDVTTVFPAAWYVRSDSVVLHLTGELPAACLLREALGTDRARDRQP